MAYSADADTILWSTSSQGVLRSQYQGSFTKISSLPASAVIAGDKRNNSYFYGGSGSSFYVSSNAGSTFAKAGTLGSAKAIRDVAAHPTTAGTVFVSTDAGVFRSTDFGATFAAVGGAVTDTQKIALGLGSGSAWNLYAFGDGPAGKKLYATAATGAAAWVDIQGSQGFGAITACVLAGSANNAGQVYVGTNGRGVFWAQGTVAGGGGGGTTSTSTSKSTTATPTTTTSSTKTTPSTSTTSTKTTLTTSTTSSAPPATGTGVSKHWDQCGGIGWTGPTACESPYACAKQNDWYSQCL